MIDAVTGKLKWFNNTSGRLDAKTGDGVSLCGNLSVSGGKLRFNGGTALSQRRLRPGHWPMRSMSIAMGRCSKPKPLAGIDEAALHIAPFQFQLLGRGQL
jgi:hypothetical protein